MSALVDDAGRGFSVPQVQPHRQGGTVLERARVGPQVGQEGDTGMALRFSLAPVGGKWFITCHTSNICNGLPSDIGSFGSFGMAGETSRIHRYGSFRCKKHI